MAETKHTAGPWHWVVHDHSCASLGVGDDPGMGTPLVMSVSPCRACALRATPKEWEWGRCCTPNEANARLIAAAPEVLGALKGLLQIVQDMRGDEEFDAMTNDAGGILFGDICNDAIEAAETAIAKAEVQL